METTSQAAAQQRFIESREWLSRSTPTVLLWIGLAVALFAPNLWTGTASIHPWADDAVSYQRIAAAAPDFISGHIASAFSERFVPHYLVGLLSDASGLSLHASYRIAALLCIAATLLVAERSFVALKGPWWAYAVGLTAFALAPYSIRPTILQPGAYQDLVFVLGTGVAILGLLRVRFAIVLAGLLIALAGRQSALLFGVAAACWILFDPKWRVISLRGRLLRAVTGVAALGVAYAVIKMVVKPISFHFAPDSLRDTIIFGPPGLHQVLAHLARCADPILIPGTALVTVLILLALAGTRLRDLPLTLWLSLLLSAAIVIQPVVITPNFPGFSSNEQRLAALGLLPLCVALAIALIEADRRRVIVPSPALLGGGLALLVLTSLHHVYTVIGPDNIKQFAALQIAGALLFAAGLVYASRTTPARVAKLSPPAERAPPGAPSS
jgi:hypothetical protein